MSSAITLNGTLPSQSIPLVTKASRGNRITHRSLADYDRAAETTAVYRGRELHDYRKNSRKNLVKSSLIGCLSMAVGATLGIVSVPCACFFVFGSLAAHLIACCEINRLVRSIELD